MPAKSKQSTAVADKMSLSRTTKADVASAQAIKMSRPNVARQWEEIRIRGEKISADIEVLLARLS